MLRAELKRRLFGLENLSAPYELTEHKKENKRRNVIFKSVDKNEMYVFVGMYLLA